MRILGWLLVLFSIFAFIGGIGMDTSIATGSGGRVHNLGLMQQQQNSLLIATAFFIAGILLIIFGRKKQSQTSFEAITPDTHVKCPDCAEFVRKEAKVCKHCGCKLIPQ